MRLGAYICYPETNVATARVSFSIFETHLLNALAWKPRIGANGNFLMAMQPAARMHAMFAPSSAVTPAAKTPCCDFSPSLPQRRSIHLSMDLEPPRRSKWHPSSGTSALECGTRRVLDLGSAAEAIVIEHLLRLSQQVIANIRSSLHAMPDDVLSCASSKPKRATYESWLLKCPSI